VKSANYKRVFGGFTDIDWAAGDADDEESQNKVSEGNSFLFSFQIEGLQILEYEKGREIGNNSEYGPLFGGINSTDLAILDNCN